MEGQVGAMGKTYAISGDLLLMPMKKNEIYDLSKKIDWTEAMGDVNMCVQLYASRIAAEGEHSPEAVARAQRILASWERIKRG